ncbi:MAG: hypothetical protein WB439_02785 [Acidobacteriaceae bacterium]
MNYCRILRAAGVAALCCFATFAQGQNQVAVKHGVGALHGFLVIRSEGGRYLGYGELSEFATGDRAMVHMVYRFRDGSLDDETTEFTQGKTYQFVNDHHIQRGRFFPKPSDITVEAGGKVTMQSVEKDGKAKVDTDQMDIPADFSNGMVGTILQNVPADAGEFKLGMIVAAGKARAIRLDITPDGEGSFRIAGVARKAKIFCVKPELGGIAGVIAPLIGKQPGNVYIWVLEGETPMIVRIVGPLAEGTASVSIELAGATFAKGSAEKK